MTKRRDWSFDPKLRVLMSRQAMAEKLRSLPWETFATLTFSKNCSAALAFESLRKFADSWPQETQGRIVWWAVAEVSPSDPSGRVHLHVLLWGLRSISEARLIERWQRFGLIAEFKPYDFSRGPEFYMQKQLWSESTSSRSVRRRRPTARSESSRRRKETRSTRHTSGRKLQKSAGRACVFDLCMNRVSKQSPMANTGSLFLPCTECNRKQSQ